MYFLKRFYDHVFSLNRCFPGGCTNCKVGKLASYSHIIFFDNLFGHIALRNSSVRPRQSDKCNFFVKFKKHYGPKVSKLNFFQKASRFFVSVSLFSYSFFSYLLAMFF